MSTFLLFLLSIAFINLASASFKEVHQRFQKRFNKDIELSANYTTKTLCIMTRDNVCLSTTIYTPKDYPAPFPVVYEKTPYGKDSLADDAVQFYSAGYVFVAQDNRGCPASNGSYTFWRSSGNDTMDTIQYLLTQTWFDGSIAVFGVSANGVSQYVDVQGVTYFDVNSIDFNKYTADYQHIYFGELYISMDMAYSAIYQGYAYREALVSGWLTDEMDQKAYIQTVLANEQFTSTYWQPLEGPYNNQWQYTNASFIHYAGFYDIFSTYQILSAIGLNDSTLNARANGNQILVIEAGGHCGRGAVIWPNATWGFDFAHDRAMDAYAGLFKNPSTFNIHDYFPWNFAWYQLGPGGIGKEGNYWVTSKGIPDADSVAWYLGNKEVLVQNTMQSDGSKSYTYNPKDPVPTYGGNNLMISPCGPQSQTSNENGRNDILHFTSNALTDNIALLGMIEVVLYVSSDAIDTDFTAKLIDIYPDGEPMLIQDSIFRMRWRNHYRNPYAYNPAPNMDSDQVYEIHIEVGIMSYIFNAGHQISLSISSSNYPRFSLNYNSGNMVIDGQKGWGLATNTVYFGEKYPSMLILPIVDLEWLRERKVQL